MANVDGYADKRNDTIEEVVFAADRLFVFGA